MALDLTHIDRAIALFDAYYRERGRKANVTTMIRWSRRLGLWPIPKQYWRLSDWDERFKQVFDRTIEKAVNDLEARYGNESHDQ